MRAYFNDARIFCWLRERFGVDKPIALGWGEWDKWGARLKAEKPLAYFLTETLPDVLSHTHNAFTAPYHNARAYIRNRWVQRSHCLNTKLKPGQYYSFNTRLINGVFEELVDFVEVETAWYHAWQLSKEDRAKYGMPKWYNLSIFRYGQWRSAKAGLDYYQWASSLTVNDDYGVEQGHPDYDKPTPQAECAKEILALYDWWKNIRPSRGDSWDATGFRDLWKKLDAKYGDDNWLLVRPSPMTDDEQAEYRKLSDATHQLEAQWDQEDEQMLIRVVKIRQHLDT